MATSTPKLDTAALQEKIAGLLGFEAALFVPTGTQSNLCAILAHCQRGDEYLVGQMAHCYRWEGGGAAVLGSVQPQPIAHQADGMLGLADIEAATLQRALMRLQAAGATAIAVPTVMHGLADREALARAALAFARTAV